MHPLIWQSSSNLTIERFRIPDPIDSITTLDRNLCRCVHRQISRHSRGENNSRNLRNDIHGLSKGTKDIVGILAGIVS